MWALGIILYQFVALNNHPFEDKSNVYAMIDNIRYNEPAPLPLKVSHYVKDIIKDLLDKNPDSRPDA